MKQLRMLVVLAVVCAFALPIFAQDFGLSADDDALLTEAVNNSVNAGSYSYEFTATMNIAGLEDADVSMDVSGSGVISADGFSMTVSGELVAEGESIPADLDVRVVDNVIYVGLMGQFFSISEEDIASLSSMAGSAGGALPFDPNALMSGEMGDMGELAGAMEALNDLDAAEFVSQERLADDGGAAVFRTSFDLGALLSNEAFGEVFQVVMEQAMAQGGGADMGDMSPEQMGMMVQMMGVMLEDATFSIDQRVDTGSTTVSGATIVVDVPLDGLTGEEGAGITMNVDVSLSDYGSAPAITAPENAQPLMDMMGAMMGSGM